MKNINSIRKSAKKMVTAILQYSETEAVTRLFPLTVEAKKYG